ncbi:hypothetical protein [Nitratireductor sp. XY-223]|nr:hypothetical protein [Nitratireductor sp. XY-223]
MDRPYSGAGGHRRQRPDAASDVMMASRFDGQSNRTAVPRGWH